MKPILLMAIVVFAAACGSEPVDVGSVPDPVPNEQALELIRDCRVTLVEGTHAGEIYLYLEDDRRVQVDDPSGIWEAASEVSDECPEMEFATE